MHRTLLALFYAAPLGLLPSTCIDDAGGGRSGIIASDVLAEDAATTETAPQLPPEPVDKSLAGYEACGALCDREAECLADFCPGPREDRTACITHCIYIGKTKRSAAAFVALPCWSIVQTECDRDAGVQAACDCPPEACGLGASYGHVWRSVHHDDCLVPLCADVDLVFEANGTYRRRSQTNSGIISCTDGTWGALCEGYDRGTVAYDGCFDCDRKSFEIAGDEMVFDGRIYQLAPESVEQVFGSCR